MYGTNGPPSLQVSVVVKWELKDDHGQDLTCFEVPVQIVDNLSQNIH